VLGPDAQLILLGVLHRFTFLLYFALLFIRNEHRFLLAGLKLEKLADWAARQAAYLTAVKELLVKLRPEFATEVDIKFVRAVSLGRGQDARLFLSVDCGSVEQSFRVRNHWGQLMRNGSARRDFPNLMVHNVITLGTRIRITILKVTPMLTVFILVNW
jgi:hypothetical protein